MNYEIITLKEQLIAGVTARTGNNDPDCGKIIGGLWQKFMSENVFENMKNKVSQYPVGLYSDYDETSYDVTVGTAVSDNGNPELSTKVIPAGKYAKFFVKGDVVKDVADAWMEIWKMPLDRSFAADFEEYISNNDGVAEVNIYIALK